MKIKKGRPKSIRGEGSFPVAKKPHHEGSLGKNRIFRNKDGSTSTVTYSGCKDKPIEMKFS